MIGKRDDRPLMTFAVFAYNQETYIREAVEGAFSQTYEPLEIILSDDCSTDKTFEMIESLAKSYTGPHTICTRQETENRGTFNHVLNVANEARGRYIIVAAGDDISLPDRCSEIVKHLKNLNKIAGCSNQSVIDQFGNEREHQESPREFDQRVSILEDTIVRPIHGATSFYQVSFLRLFPISAEPILIEDYIFSVFLAAHGYENIYIEKPLVKYRHHDQNISIREGFENSLSGVRDKETRQNKRRREFAKALCYIKDQAEGGSSDNASLRGRLNLEMLNAKIDFLQLAARWPNLCFREKMSWIQSGLKTKQMKTVLPRLFGLSVFSNIYGIFRFGE